jgi:hypothetical protein
MLYPFLNSNTENTGSDDTGDDNTNTGSDDTTPTGDDTGTGSDGG